MIDQTKFFSILKTEHIDFFTGVPDSFLNGFCNYLSEHISEEKNIIAANEGNAIAIASGYHFCTKNIPMVYMQNSGIGNAINPLVSLADKDVYRVPMLLLIGWRGQPGAEPNHPQHKKQGAILLNLLDTMDIPYVIPDGNADLEDKVRYIIGIARKKNTPVAIIAKKGVFAQAEKKNELDDRYPLSREEVIEILLDVFPKDTIFVATTGRATRELYFLREKRKESHSNDFLNLGAMGHASSVALGIAMNSPHRKVVCLDGDAAAIMHMGAMTMMSKYEVPNMLHIILNNGVHESVGGQASAGYKINLTQIAAGCGYANIGHEVSTKEELLDAVMKLNNGKKAGFVDTRIHKGLLHELPPLHMSSIEAITNLKEELTKERV